ncbi:MAG: 50S ribosomal protein L18 [Thaumarchaeota archaeon]|nr:MAG: 50S ribosomal protein L18 [Thaumarchaeota archaeon 13_1_40CM_2_39_13_1]OLE40214.1 MAG: 50S ribosomal protein L18 [Thaumarchaeota archaeon 13_1_20CM_2_39_20]TLX93379.1 MAG: 50S ribosomal protein L18 [Nitrososphaerota archaeon]
MTYSQILRRSRDEKTNYKKRRNLLMGRRDFITVQISNENTLVQIHKPELAGDKVLSSAHSRSLLGKGWKGSRKSIPAAYLTGYLAGKKALAQGIKSAVLYSGTRRYTQRMAAALKGIIDAGLQVPADTETFPSEERISGKHLKVANDIEKVKSAIGSEVKSK